MVDLSIVLCKRLPEGRPNGRRLEASFPPKMGHPQCQSVEPSVYFEVPYHSQYAPKQYSQYRHKRLWKFGNNKIRQGNINLSEKLDILRNSWTDMVMGQNLLYHICGVSQYSCTSMNPSYSWGFTISGSRVQLSVAFFLNEEI